MDPPGGDLHDKEFLSGWRSALLSSTNAGREEKNKTVVYLSAPRGGGKKASERGKRNG